MHREFPPIALIAAASLLLPLPWHWRAGNVATLSIICWLFITNVIYAVDAIVWGNNVDIVIPVWCDITSKIIIGCNFALPAACLCICIHLEQVASVRVAKMTRSDKQRRQIFEGLMCFGLPILFMGLHYIVQGHRFDIIEEYGCRPTTYVSIAAIFIIYVPTLLLAIACLVFASLALRHFFRRRISFNLHLNASNSALTTSRYLRLMLMSVLQMIWVVSLTVYTLWFTLISTPLRPWTNWDFVHSNFSRIDLYITAFTPMIVVRTYYILWWTIPASSFIFVAFFAFGQDAIEDYKSCFIWFRRRILRQIITPKGSKGTFGSLPTDRDRISAPTLSHMPLKSISSLPSYKAATKAPHMSTKSCSIEDSRSDLSLYNNPSSLTYDPETKIIASLEDFGPPTPSSFSPSSEMHEALYSPPSPLTPPPRPGSGSQFHSLHDTETSSDDIV